MEKVLPHIMPIIVINNTVCIHLHLLLTNNFCIRHHIWRILHSGSIHDHLHCMCTLPFSIFVPPVVYLARQYSLLTGTLKTKQVKMHNKLFLKSIYSQTQNVAKAYSWYTGG